jgi:hypothetical protein
VVVLGSLLAVGTVIAAGAPPPQSVCGPCNDGLVDEARMHNLPLNVTSSTAAVEVHPNGSATWTVTSRLATNRRPDRNAYAPNATLRNVSALRTNETLRRSIVREAVDDSRDYLEPDRPDATLRSMDLSNSTLRFTFFEPDVARQRPGSVLLFEEYHTGGLGSGWYVDVNTVEIVGPPNTTVGNDVTAAFGSDIAAVDGNRVILDGDPAEPPTVAQDDLYIAFVSLGDGPGLRSWLAILLVTMPTVLATFTSLHLPGLIVLLFGLAVVHVRRIQREEALAGTAPALLLWVAGAIAAYLAIGFTIFPPIYPHPMLNTILATSLLVYALLVAGGSWVLYPVFGQLFGD